jgi:glucosamine 6-phosphate synthetase-like amidotransferase/phosphosugar isomerase protein
MSECDSEIIAVYLAEEMSKGASLEESMQKSLDELDGVFTYIAVTENELGVAKDELAAKPLVLYESDELVALASEEIAIQQLVDHEIDTTTLTSARSPYGSASYVGGNDVSPHEPPFLGAASRHARRGPTGE